jgi:hypothetical protein
MDLKYSFALGMISVGDSHQLNFYITKDKELMLIDPQSGNTYQSSEKIRLIYF